MKLKKLDNKIEINDISFHLHGMNSCSHDLYICIVTQSPEVSYTKFIENCIEMNDMKHLIHTEPISWLATLQHAYTRLNGSCPFLDKWTAKVKWSEI
jgi:hypothetical protein